MVALETDPLREALRKLAAADEFAGVVHVEGATGAIFAEAFGAATRRWNVPASMATRYDTASITKLFTAVAVLQQVDRRRFDLDTSVVDYLDLDAPHVSPGVTTYHLLTHTSGIGDDADEEAGERYEDLWVDRPNYSVTDTAHFLPQCTQRPAWFEPGQGCRYNNCAYVFLGLMVERASGMPYRDYVMRHVFAPAGMRSSGFFRMDGVDPDVAEGVAPVRDTDGSIIGWYRNIYSYPPIGSPDGGAHATASDLVRFHDAVRTGVLLAPEWSTAMLVPREHYRARGDGAHMTGFAVRSYWKEGTNVGASGMLRHYPDVDVTVVVLSNLEEGAWEPLRLIDRAVGVQ
jgi:CubicO group peptidase (beta-lactamase class C family)